MNQRWQQSSLNHRNWSGLFDEGQKKVNLVLLYIQTIKKKALGGLLPIKLQI